MKINLFYLQQRWMVFASILGTAMTVMAEERITFTDQIAPIIHSKCAQCHRPGEAAPFTLMTYDQVKKRSRMILSVVEDRYMPPWHPVPGHGTFRDNRRLSDQEIELIRQWVENGSPQGDPASMPPLPEFTEGWQLGEPDLVVEMKAGFEVPADGPDIYRTFVIPLELEEDKWIKAIELRPEARPVVHHVLYFLNDDGAARAKDGADGKPGFRGMRVQVSGRLGGYVPGVTVTRLPGDLAYALPQGSDLMLQTHFHPTGKVETERFTVGLYFADQAPKKELVTIQVPPFFGRGEGIDIPAGEKNYQVEDSFTIPVEVDAHIVGGHAHYLCEEMRMTAALPDGSSIPLLYIDDWDLNWQDQYTYQEPVRLPAGTVVKTELRYDNSEDNYDNPSYPPVRVKWGQESTDEMGSITLKVTAVDKSNEFALTQALQGYQLAGMINKKLLKSMPIMLALADRNGDGSLQASEMPQRLKTPLLKGYDANRNGMLDADEMEAIQEWLKSIGNT